MAERIRKVAILGQGLIGSSITRAIYQRDLPLELTITDASRKVCDRLLELGLGRAKVVYSNQEAVEGADLVIGCVPVAAYAELVREIAPHLKPGAILSDVGSVKAEIIKQSQAHVPGHVHLVPAHPLAGTEFSGPDAGLPKLFVNRWCILTPPQDCDQNAIKLVKGFWESIGSKVEIMSAEDHDYTLAITSHLPHLSAFSIFHTARDRETERGEPVVQFSAGTFRDFTRVAMSNPRMWRDIFILNREALHKAFNRFVTDIEEILKAVDAGDAERVERLISESRQMRAESINEEDYTSSKSRITQSTPPDIKPPYSAD